jgi:copper transport protein
MHKPSLVLPRPTFRAAALTALALIALFSVRTPGVSAHAGYDHSTPADEGVVATAPTTVDVFFKEEVERSGGLPTLIVVDASGDQVDTGATLDDNDRTHMSAPLESGLEGGRYSVIWHTVSADDGEEAQGAFHFYIGEKTTPAPGSQTTGASSTATVRPSASTSPSTDDSGSDVSIAVLIIAIVVAAVVGGGAGYFAGRMGRS